MLVTEICILAYNFSLDFYVYIICYLLYLSGSDHSTYATRENVLSQSAREFNECNYHEGNTDSVTGNFVFRSSL